MATAIDSTKNNITFIGKCNFRGSDRVFGIKQKDRRQHTYVIGKTGVGKSVLLKNMALQDIRAGRGLAIVDPHGEFVEEVLEQIPESRMNDVVYFNPVDDAFPIGFNVLEVPDPQYKHLIVSGLLGIFTKIWANVWSARMEYILQNCILALADTPGTTLLGIPRILVDKEYREKIIANVKDPVVRSFWLQEYETWRDQFRNEAIVPIQNKVGQFLNTDFVRNIVGQEKSTLDIPHIMDAGKILLVNVSKGRIGEDNSALLGAMIITKIQIAAMERVRIAEEDRIDFHLYVDEFQNFATDSFASILSEARKYRLNLTIAHQYIGQLVTDVSTKVRDAVFGNVGTMMTFRVGAADAEELEKEFTPECLMNDLIGLPNHHIYIKLMVDGVTSRPFSATTLPPLKFETDPTVKEKIIRVSRERYGMPKADVEKKIAQWSGMLEGGEYGGELPPSGKQMFDAKCWNCGKETQVPFKPNGKRPVYCLSCLKQIEDGKLIPLPERMPQIGRARFPESLSGIGIEFEASRQSDEHRREGDRTRRDDTRRASFAPSSSPSHTPAVLPRSPSPRMPDNSPARPRSPMHVSGGSSAPASRLPVSGSQSHYSDHHAPPNILHENRSDRPREHHAVRQEFSLRSVPRAPQPSRTISLSALKRSEVPVSHTGVVHSSHHALEAKPPHERSKVDTLALRSVLETFVHEPSRATPVHHGPESSDKKRTDTKKERVIQPGETVHL
ncbi:MAG: type IV secretion system DNA-binding domain-containing protein [bacterium]|nr:type IV secretion system DNA-binding domain-containing protein [bacterium]MDZ4299844.1 CxxC-x17-CxxC domain-containing protein [Candidatus Sungbacteria bacterium]